MLFRLVLWLIGVLLAVASRASPRLRAQLARDMTFNLASKDGGARSFHFRDRRVTSHSGLTPNAECSVSFQSGAQAVRILLASDAVAQIVAGLAAHEIELDGEPTTVLWFYEMVIAYAPWHKAHFETMPDAYTAPSTSVKVDDRITREPAVAALDPARSDAIKQREKLVIWRVGRGAPVPGKPSDFKFVVDVPAVATQEST